MIAWKRVSGLRPVGGARWPSAPPAMAQEDPGPAAYESALKGKRVVLVPMAMGFDLAQGWAALPQARGRRPSAACSRPAIRTGASRPAPRRSPRLISSDPKPDVLVVHSPDLNSYSKLFKKAQEAGHLCRADRQSHQLSGRRLRRQRLGPAGPARGRSRDQGLRREFVEEDRPGAGRSGQRLEPVSVCRHHEGDGEASGLQDRGQARSRTGTPPPPATSPRPCCSRIPISAASSISGTATPPAPRRRSATPGWQDKIFLVTTGGGEKVDCDSLENGTFGAVVMTELAGQSRDINALHQVPAAERPAARNLEDPDLHAGEGDRPRPTSSPTPAGT